MLQVKLFRKNTQTFIIHFILVYEFFIRFEFRSCHIVLKITPIENVIKNGVHFP